MKPEESSGPRAIGKYQVIGTLGRGSMGVVYKARDPEIGREVAVKTLRKILSTQYRDADAALERFRTEARSAGNLRHPNIVAIFEANRENDTPYLVMDYIEGESLDLLISRFGKIPPRRALHFFSQIAAALDYAHSKGVIHRDIKPSNILVDGNDTVFVLDFGVATINNSFGAQPTEERENSVVGTPGYMSPEQILNQRLDHRSDLFSFATVAFEVLTGCRPFPGDTFTAVIGNILSAKPIPINTLAPELPLEAGDLFKRAFLRNPEERFNSGQELVAAMAAAIGVDLAGKSQPAKEQLPARKRKSTGWRTFIKAETGSKVEQSKRARRHTLGGASPWGASGKPLDLETPAALKAAPTPGAIFGQLEVGAEGSGLHFSSPLIRMLTALTAVFCIFLGVLVLWLLISAPSRPGPNGANPNEPSAGQEPSAQALASLEQPLLTLPKFDEPVPLGKHVSEMTNRELLGLITSSKSAEADILHAIREAQQRSVAGLVEACVVAMHHDSYLVRAETIKMLSEIGDKRIVPELVLTLDDHDPIVRGHAAKALGVLADKRALAYLTATYMKEDVPEVKAALRIAIERINGFPMK